ncbi:MAG: penicillin-binding transpeptidase domain-containing protein [Clostridiaceae bacterium]|nr:penicillin-binding transpeptidase domain-containing protein [Clostridiaceae bacterium]
MAGILRFFKKKAKLKQDGAENYRNMDLFTLPGTRLYRKNNYMIIHKKRLQIIGLLFIAVYGLLICRLFYIQVYMGKSYSERAVRQRMVNIPISTNRGIIYDRNMIPITDREVKKAVIAYPDFVYDKKAASETISKACGIPMETVEKKMEGSADTVEFICEVEQNEYLSLIDSGRIKGVIAVEKRLRYAEDDIAKHVVGYIGKTDKIGQMGIEKSMNSYLESSGSDSIAAVVDSGKNIIRGLGFRKVEAAEDGTNYSLKLTLDYHIQNIIEAAMEDNDIEGSIVVMDVKNGDILGMASKPDFDQSNVDKYIKSSGNELINKSIWQFDLGSIFKTVVAAAAIEGGYVDPEDKYKCQGYIDVGSNRIKCSTYKSHEDREINMKEAFALSCNSTYIQIGMKTGAENILEMAGKFGLGQKLCFTIPEEKAGYIPGVQEDGIGNISIGQGKIQVTPLQVTCMMATIANNGIRNDPQLVDSLITEKGLTVKKLERSRPQIVLNPVTSKLLKDMLHEVTVTGTGKQANIEEYGGSCGKTSSTQTGINEGEVVHGWFAGFAPYEKPKYAITVFIYNGKSGGGAAAPVFKEVAVKILRDVKR